MRNLKKNSYPKNKISVLLLENIHDNAARAFSSETYRIKRLPSALDESELVKEIEDVSVLCIRSKTQLTEKALASARRLLAVGAFCIGTNQIDLRACEEKGVPVFNAPFSNTRSVVELALGEIIMLLRKACDKSAGLHKGEWDKSARGCFEARGKTLGIIGYGKIGSQLSVLAEALGMEVYFYDLEEKLALGKAKRCRTLKELLRSVQIVSVHVDGRKENQNLLSAKELAMMKKGSYLLNISRGEVVDAGALAKFVRSGHIAGAAVDVFAAEPKRNGEKFSSPLQGLPNVILTPHIGGSTQEAQEDIAAYVPSKIIEYINTGNTSLSVNFPNIQLPPLSKAHRIIHTHKNVPGILARLNEVFAKNGINILGQYLKTDELVGYVITDIARGYGSRLMDELKAVPHTIKARILY